MIDELLWVRHKEADTIQDARSALLENLLSLLRGYDLNVVLGRYALRSFDGSIEDGITRRCQVLGLGDGSWI